MKNRKVAGSIPSHDKTLKSCVSTGADFPDWLSYEIFELLSLGTNPGSFSLFLSHFITELYWLPF
jgi:hypothetical protein